jgi:hypothetical protein
MPMLHSPYELQQAMNAPMSVRLAAHENDSYFL